MCFITKPITNSSLPDPELCGMQTATKTAGGRASHCPPNPILVAHPKGSSDIFALKSIAVMKDTYGDMRAMIVGRFL